VDEKFLPRTGLFGGCASELYPPSEVKLPYAVWPTLQEGGIEIQFRLIYEGQLPPSTSGKLRKDEKHEIRKVFHKQLSELWERVEFLRIRKTVTRHHRDDEKTRVEIIADRYSRCGYRFVPLVEHRLGLACSLDILFLRRDNPGDLVKSGG